LEFRPDLWVAWLVERLTTPFSTKIGYIGDKILGGDLDPPRSGWPTIQTSLLFCFATTQNEKR